MHSGPSVSTANANGHGNTNGHPHHHHHHRNRDGVAGIGDPRQDGRSSGGGGGGGGGGGVQRQEPPNTPGSNRKGHDEEETLLRGVGDLLTRARRGVNSYFSALARKQRNVARQQRERARRKSSSSNNCDFLVEAEEGVGLLSIAGGGTESADATKAAAAAAANGGPLHRSQSAVFVPSRPDQQAADASSATSALETRSAGVVTDVGELRDVSEMDPFLQEEVEGLDAGCGVEASAGGLSARGGGGGGGGGGGSMNRAGRAGLTTGDLVRLYREEEQGAGEDSAQDEDRERLGSSQGKSVGGRRSRWGLSRKAAAKATQVPQLKDRKSDVEQLKRDREQWADHGFKVLGVEIGHLPQSQQVTLLVGGVFFFLLIYGYMQEYLVVKIFERKFGLFMTFLQFFGYATCAALRRGVHRETVRKVPLRIYFGLGFLQAVMQGLTNVSMMYLNYPAKVLFKSSRMVPIMCFGVVWQGKRYSMRDCLVVCFIVTGLATFMNAETRSSAESDTPCSLLGILCISLALVIDAANINMQEEVMNEYASCQDELIMFSYLCGTVYVASYCVFSGELISGFMFLHEKGPRALVAVMLYCGAGFLGGSCAVALTKKFGALHSAITTTARKAVTLMLSFAYFQKAFTPQHLVGATVFMIGLMTKMFGKHGKSSAQTEKSAENSPAATPFIQPHHRKRLSDAEAGQSSSAALSSGGSGGDPCSGDGYGVVRGSHADTTCTQSPSPVRQEGPASLAGAFAGYPVRHRGNPKLGGSPAAGGGGGIGSERGRERAGGGGRGGHWVRQKQFSPPRSPFRARIASPPVTGLGMVA
ncbi:unnamed protein product [Ectocarpus sp. 6 AP-2014]